MFAYCWNSPMALFDPNGHAVFRINWLDGSGGEWYTDGTSLAYAFSPAPSIGGGICSGYSSNIIEIPSSSTAGNVIARVIAAAGAGAMIGNCLAPAAYPNKDNDDNKPSQTIIYRYGATKTDKLAPTAEHGDYDGLSFSLKMPTSTKQYPVAVTTIEAIEATGILTTVQNGKHVSIKPVNGTVIDWIEQGMDSQWSQVLSEIIIVIGE